MKTVTLDESWYVEVTGNGKLSRLKRKQDTLPGIKQLREFSNDQELDYGNCFVLVDGLEYKVLKTRSWLLHVELL